MYRLISNSAHIKSSVCFHMEFDMGNGKRTKKHVEVSVWDKVFVQYFEPRFGNKGEVISCKARVSKIIHVPNRCNSEDISIQLDASVDMISKTFIVPVKNILDIDLLEEDGNNENIPSIPSVDPEEVPDGPQAISWTLNPVCIEYGTAPGQINLLKVPYARHAAGTVYFTVTDTAGNLYFKEKFVTETENMDANFTWSLRSYEGVAEKLKEAGVDPVLTDKNGFFIYQNGDSLNSIIANTDRDNSLIIPEGTVLVFTIMHTPVEEIGEPVTKIVKEYVVKKEDVEAVTITA